MALEMLAECVMILRSRSRSYLAHRRQSYVGWLKATDVPTVSHADRPASEARKGKDGSISLRGNPPCASRWMPRDTTSFLWCKGEPEGLCIPEGLGVNECYGGVRAVNLLGARCV